ncbi:tRNA-dihydrouridine synthase [Enterocytozoon bieneusi H348]|nr:tRNA-dihydrouridine synthase [Enterocytozoon bieneusi H348]|eukprot:XP_002650206.1 tRNA-dihydrouridine synthase [Enterocytozoon bieneusi H348]
MAFELDKMINAIEKELVKCEQNLNNIGIANIKIKSFQNLLSNIDMSPQELDYYQNKLQKLTVVYKQLASRRTLEKSSLHKEMYESNITIQRINEISKPNKLTELTNEQFYEMQNNQLDNILTKGFDSLLNLKRQDKFITNIDDRIKYTLSKIGMSSELLYKIERITLGNKRFFYTLFIVIVILLFVFRFLI